MTNLSYIMLVGAVIACGIAGAIAVLAFIADITMVFLIDRHVRNCPIRHWMNCPSYFHLPTKADYE